MNMNLATSELDEYEDEIHDELLDYLNNDYGNTLIEAVEEALSNNGYDRVSTPDPAIRIYRRRDVC